MHKFYLVFDFNYCLLLLPDLLDKRQLSILTEISFSKTAMQQKTMFNSLKSINQNSK